MKSWSLNMRDGTDSINFDFETGSSKVLASKINSFLNVCSNVTGEPEEDVSIADELYCIRAGIEGKIASVFSAGNDPSEEERLTDILHAVNEVINYVESEL